MRVLLSSIGTRGDVQPLVALGLQLKALGVEAPLCVAPNFAGWIESLGLECRPVGPDLEQWSRGSSLAGPRPTAEQLRALATEPVRLQFRVLADAMCDCDAVLGAGTLQFAARSLAEARGIPYVFAAYCPAVIPSSSHAPPRIREHFPQDLSAQENRALWEMECRSWNGLFGATLNEERAKLGLAAVDDVLRHIVGEEPWLAADPVLGPAPAEVRVTQTGAWLHEDSRELPAELREFLRRGEPPVYFGFGSMRTAEGTAAAMIEAARALGLRALVSRGWAQLAPVDERDDCLFIDDVSHAALLPRVAAVVHHGGAGTTHAAAGAGRAQVVVPHNYDQFYWARRVAALGIGVAAPERAQMRAQSLADALRDALTPDIRRRAAAVAAEIRADAAGIAARNLVSLARASIPAGSRQFSR